MQIMEADSTSAGMIEALMPINNHGEAAWPCSPRASLKPAGSFIVFPGNERHPLGRGVEAVPLPALARMLTSAAKL